jgi:hypothetical protein
MTTSHSIHVTGLLLALLAASACRATDTKPERTPATATSSEPVPPTPREPNAPETSASDSAPADSATDQQFEKLLSSMGVRFFAGDRLEIPGWVNMQSGVVEVFACAPSGKTHEAVVVLDCVPSGLQAGLLALGLEPGTPVEFGAGGAFKPPTGDPVEIQVRWKDAGGEERLAFAEDWVFDEKHGQPMPRGSWVFAGSYFQEGPTEAEGATFAADYVKSLATTFHDASSILENSRSEGFDDTVYTSYEKAVPPVGTPITAIFRRAK